jgi:hypothetical protein
MILKPTRSTREPPTPWWQILLGVLFAIGLLWRWFSGTYLQIPGWNGAYWWWVLGGWLLIVLVQAVFLAWNRREWKYGAAEWSAQVVFTGLMFAGSPSFIEWINALGKGSEVVYTGTVDRHFSVKASGSSHLGDSFGDFAVRLAISEAMGRTYTIGFIDEATTERIFLDVPRKDYEEHAIGASYSVRMRIGLLGIPYRWILEP